MGLISRVSSRTYRKKMSLIGDLLQNEENTTPLKPENKLPKRKFKKTSKIEKKAEKGAPLEFSSKHKIKNPSILQKHAEKVTDPRFSDDFGSYKAENFEKYYGFIEDIEKNELEQLKKQQKSLAGKRRKRQGKTSEFEHNLIQTIKSKKQRLDAKDQKRKEKVKEKERKKEELQL